LRPVAPRTTSFRRQFVAALAAPFAEVRSGMRDAVAPGEGGVSSTSRADDRDAEGLRGGEGGGEIEWGAAAVEEEEARIWWNFVLGDARSVATAERGVRVCVCACACVCMCVCRVSRIMGLLKEGSVVCGMGVLLRERRHASAWVAAGDF